MMKLNTISVAIKQRQLFSVDYLEFPKGTMTALLGKNGSGKSTFLRGLCGFNQEITGSVDFFGCEMKFGKHFRPFNGMSYVPVKQPVFGQITLVDVVLSGRSATRNFLDLPSKEELQEALEVLDVFGLRTFSQAIFTELSDGEQKMGLIARSIFQNAAVILLDEPEAFLDVGNRARMFKELRKLADEGKIIILSTHQPQLAVQYCDFVAYIHECQLELIPAVDCSEELINRVFG